MEGRIDNRLLCSLFDIQSGFGGNQIEEIQSLWLLWGFFWQLQRDRFSLNMQYQHFLCITVLPIQILVSISVLATGSVSPPYRVPLQ